MSNGEPEFWEKLFEDTVAKNAAKESLLKEPWAAPVSMGVSSRGCGEETFKQEYECQFEVAEFEEAFKDNLDEDEKFFTALEREELIRSLCDEKPSPEKEPEPDFGGYSGYGKECLSNQEKEIIGYEGNIAIGHSAKSDGADSIAIGINAGHYGYGAVPGTVAYDSSEDKLLVHDGAEWVETKSIPQNAIKFDDNSLIEAQGTMVLNAETVIIKNLTTGEEVSVVDEIAMLRAEIADLKAHMGMTTSEPKTENWTDSHPMESSESALDRAMKGI